MKNFLRLRRQGALTPLTKILRTFKFSIGSSVFAGFTSVRNRVQAHLKCLRDLHLPASRHCFKDALCKCFDPQLIHHAALC